LSLFEDFFSRNLFSRDFQLGAPRKGRSCRGTFSKPFSTPRHLFALFFCRGCFEGGPSLNSHWDLIEVPAFCQSYHGPPPCPPPGGRRYSCHPSLVHNPPTWPISRVFLPFFLGPPVPTFLIPLTRSGPFTPDFFPFFPYFRLRTSFSRAKNRLLLLLNAPSHYPFF